MNSCVGEDCSNLKVNTAMEMCSRAEVGDGSLRLRMSWERDTKYNTPVPKDVIQNKICGGCSGFGFILGHSLKLASFNGIEFLLKLPEKFLHEFSKLSLLKLFFI